MNKPNFRLKSLLLNYANCEFLLENQENNCIPSATERLSSARSSLSSVSPGIAAEISRVFQPYKRQINQSPFFDPKKPAPSRSGRGHYYNTRTKRNNRSTSSMPKSMVYVKRLIVLRPFDEGEQNTKTTNSILVDGQFTFSNRDNEETMKRKILDIMVSADESFEERQTSDLAYDSCAEDPT